MGRGGAGSEEHDEEEWNEEEEDVSDEASDEDEEEDVGRHRKKAEKAKPAKPAKKKKRSGFIDDAAEEDDEDARPGRKRLRASAFIDDIAEVDEDEDEDDDEDEGLDDLIADEGDELPSAADLHKMRREIREAELAAARDNEPNPEELEKYIKERFGNRSYASYGYDEEGGDGRPRAVGQQALMPTATDPKLWVVRCGEGQEREAVVCLLQKCYDLAKRGTPLLIKAAFCQDHLKGYFYVEAHKEAHVKEALKGLRMIFQSKPPKLVPLKEMVDAIRVAKGAEKAIEAGSWVRMKGGIYKHDLAKVIEADPSNQRATIKLVPRIDLAALAARKPEDARANFGKQPKVKPPAKPFNPDEAKAHRLDVHQQRDRATGDVFYILNNNQRFLEGYLVRSIAMKSLILQESLPPLDELQKFNAAAQSEDAGPTDLAGIMQNLQTEGGAGEGSAAPAPKFEKLDRVLVVEGDLKNIKGVVQHIAEDGGIMVQPQDESLGDFKDVIRFEPRELSKYFESGEHVKVVHGQHEGETGMVVRVETPVAYVFTDSSHQEIKVFVRDLTLAVATASSADSLGGYEMHDLVVLDNTTVGVIVNVEQDALRVLTNQGRPDKPDIRVCRLPDIKRKMNNRRASVKDGAGNDVNVNDAVDVVDGPLKGRSGTVKYIMRGFLFIQTREVSENAGFICLQARHTKVRGGRSAARGGGVGMTPGRSPAYGLLASPHPSRGPQQPVLASPGRQGGFGGGPGGPPGSGVYSGRITTQQDKMLEGRSITIRKGPFRGMRGRVISATATHVRLELEAQMKTVTVDRSHLAMEEGGRAEAAPRPGFAYPAANTPMAAAGRTPMHPGVTATPMHYSSMGQATPMHPGMTPGRETLTKTPAYDPAWAATPAHPGFGGGGPAGPGGYPNAGTPAFADTPGTVNPGGYGGAAYAPSPAAYAPSPAGYAPSPAGYGPAGTPAVAGTPGMYAPAGTPGMYAPAGTPGMYAPAGTPGVYGAADMPAPTPGGGQYGGPATAGSSQDYSHWVDVEVKLPGGDHAVVRSVEGGTATVTVGQEAGEGRYAYPPDAASRAVPCSDMQLVCPDRKEAIRIVRGDLAGQYGDLVGTDGGDGIIKLGADIKIMPLADIGRLAVQPEAGGDTFDTTSNTTQPCTELFCPLYSLGIAPDPLRQAATARRRSLLQNENTSAGSGAAKGTALPEVYSAVGLDSGILASEFKRKRLNLALLLDVSGSMDSPFNRYYYDSITGEPKNLTDREANMTKVDVAKEVLTGIVDLLKPEDSFSITLFSDGACTPKAFGPVSCVDIPTLKAQIMKDVNATSGTALSTGWDQATAELKPHASGNLSEVENRIILISDQEPNSGDFTTEGLAARLKNNSEAGIFTTIIGVGLDFNTELVEAISKVKGANYFSVHSPGEFKQRLVDEFDYAVTPLVFDLALQVVTTGAGNASDDSGWRILHVYGSPNPNETALSSDGTVMRVHTLFPSPKTEQGIKGGVVLLRLRPPAKGANTPLRLAVTYSDREGKQFRSERTVALPAGFTAAAAASSGEAPMSYYQSTGVRKAVLLARYTDMLQGWLIDEWNAIDANDTAVINATLCGTFPSAFCPDVDAIAKYEVSPAPEGACKVNRWLLPDGCLLPVPFPVMVQLSEWERTSHNLTVSPDAKQAFQAFLPYLQEEMVAVNDTSLQQEVDLLNTLIAVTVEQHLLRSGTNDLPKTLSLADLVFLGIGSIIGAGVFVLSGVAANELAGPAVIVSYLVAATAALLSALCYAEMAVSLPVAGGAFNYISVSFGELAAWTVAWNISLETTLSSAAVARGFASYLATLIGLSASALRISVGPIQLDPAAALLVLLLTALLIKGTKESSLFNMVVSGLNVASILFVLCAGFPSAKASNLSPFAPFGGKGVFAASAVVFFAFVGFDYVANAAEEATDPAKDLPWGIVGSLGVATLLYVLMSLCIVMMVPYQNIDVNAPFSAAFLDHGMAWAAKIVSLGAVLGIVTSSMTGLLGQSRLFVVLGRERLLPARLAAVSPRTGTPVEATLLTGCMAATLALLLDIGLLAELVSIGTLYVFICVCSGTLYNRYHQPGSGSSAKPVLAALLAMISMAAAFSLSFTFDAGWPAVLVFLLLFGLAAASLYLLPVQHVPEKFRVPLFPATPSLGILFTVHLIGSLGWLAYVRFGVWMAIGLALYALYGVHGAEQREREHDSELEEARARESNGAEAPLPHQLTSLDHEGLMGGIELSSAPQPGYQLEIEQQQDEPPAVLSALARLAGRYGGSDRARLMAGRLDSSYDPGED
ncbi:transcription elongation factor SPT5-like protein 1 [Chlorella sorokiniana]|uniref:Transcription elongation factor SPT5 n=1 Tax=Chlorella sorokiniana TaxID=3076 RepID=A0A2P6U0L1_CHLSO|nr:transcription elongation factor SPT5-like protein 1 [Chlorella sorokiniana]|eukprot:PRW59844.1 transcription elongation factor SPT5-like protein 1 [Chlorella sorokiniana]